MSINNNPLLSFPGADSSLIGAGGFVSDIGAAASADPFVYNGVDNFADYQALLDAPATNASIHAFLLSYNSNTNPIPSDITKFVKDFVASQGLLVNISGVDVPDPAIVKNVLTGFLKAFQQNITGSIDPSTAWPELAGVIQLTGDLSDPNQFAQLEAAFKDFISVYPYAGNGTAATATTSPNYAVKGFFQKWRDYTTINSVISGTPSAAPEILGGGFSVPTYEVIFNSFYPAFATPLPNPSSPTGQTYFAEFMQQFYQGEVQRYGFFSPSHSLTNWIGYVQDLAGLTLVSPTARVPETKTKIINNLLLLLISMISSIQNIAAAQADRLALYSNWQRGYTSLLGQVHVFTQTSKDKLRGTDEDTVKIRRDIQTNFNSAVIQRLTSQKDVVTDDAKAMQSRVNQSSDAFNEQANIATALLQQLSTLLSTIMK